MHKKIVVQFLEVRLSKVLLGKPPGMGFPFWLLYDQRLQINLCDYMQTIERENGYFARCWCKSCAFVLRMLSQMIHVLIIQCSKRLAQETPNGRYVNQYDNPSNAQANYEQTGPEIWEQNRRGK